MQFKNLPILISAFGILCLGASPAAAQFAAGSPRASITGTGQAVISRAPTIVQVHITLPGKGASLKEALAGLAERREKARELLAALQADEDSIAFSPPTVSTGQSEQRRQFESMVVERMQGMGREVPEGLASPEMHKVTSKLSAEWSLSGASVEEMLLETEALKKEIEAADLAGTKEEEAKSLEEAELMEEMAAMETYSASYGGSEQIEPGTPHFTYLARITEEERAEAMAEAYRKAQVQAQSLAEAAGVERGPLVGLYGRSSGQSQFADSMYGYQYRQYLQQMMSGFIEEMNRELEAIGPTPEPLKFTFNVSAVFELVGR